MGRYARLKLLASLALSLAVILASFPAAAEEVDEELFRKIEANLMCTDGCGMYLAACDNATAERMRQQIREKLAAGLTEKEIYAYMISIYGEEVMAAPPPQVPFNITAWVTPFLAILGGGVAIYLALDRWVFNRHRATPQETTDEEINLAGYEGILEEEIKKYL